ncbi:MAG TPA: hypothetical protein VID27_14950, partial [Blastocatellia bacterium]
MALNPFGEQKIIFLQKGSVEMKSIFLHENSYSEKNELRLSQISQEHLGGPNIRQTSVIRWLLPHTELPRPAIYRIKAHHKPINRHSRTLIINLDGLFYVKGFITASASAAEIGASP